MSRHLSAPAVAAVTVSLSPALFLKMVQVPPAVARCRAVALLLVMAGALTTHVSSGAWPKPPTCPRLPDYNAEYDFLNNVYKEDGHVTQIGQLQGQGCSTAGVLKIALASAAEDPQRRRVIIDLTFYNPTGWVFNLGDSSTNNGYAGDASTQSNDAELQGTGTTFNGYLSDYGNSVLAFTLPQLYSTCLRLLVSNGQVVWIPDDINKSNFYSNPALFALNGQDDLEGQPNYDLFLGMNQVVAGGRTGSGLCKVGIKFLPDI